MSTVAIGILGSRLDATRRNRTDRWRPSVALCLQPKRPLARFHLLVHPGDSRLARQVKHDIAELAPDTEVILHELPINHAWDFEEVFGALHDLSQQPGLYDAEQDDLLIHITTGTHVEQICLFLLTESRHLPGRIVQTGPSKERDRVGNLMVIDLDLSRYDAIAARFEAERRTGVDLLKQGIQTRNEAFNRTIEQLARVAQASTAPMLLVGPTGAGKTRLASRIYTFRKEHRLLRGPFVEVNCATLRGDQAMSTLFGHRRGAFTGAVSDRPGLLKAAHGGLLFLDEIAELGLDEQAMLLRAIEHGRFMPLGTDKEVESEFQLIAGTNADLRKRSRDGRFRDDLLARIDLWTFELPGLRDRPEDIEPNLDYELAAYGRRNGRMVRMNREARAAFLAHSRAPNALWSGNFRDLSGAVERMATLSTGGRIAVSDVEEEYRRLNRDWSVDGVDDRVTRVLGADAAAQLDRFERVQLEDVLSVCSRSASLSAAGRELFAQSRQRRASTNDADRLRKYLARFGLTHADTRV